MTKLKIYDCSLNSFAPKHRSESLGPKENDLMFDLKRYQDVLGVVFIDDYKLADRIITNTTYTPEIINWSKKNSIPLIKRMDGVFWRYDLIDRNIPLNEAAHQSDNVIFISKFSQDSYHKLYGTNLKNECVILNNVDETIFKPDEYDIRRNHIRIWGTSATNWCRDEKRPSDLLKFADMISDDERILTIGKSLEINHPKIIGRGYFTDYNELSEEINCVDAWVNFSYRDAAPKTVLQAISCGKPVLYANSGGLHELVGDYGIAIDDNKEIDFSYNNHELDFNIVMEKYELFKRNYEKNIFKKPVKKKYIDTLKEYINIIKNNENI